MNNPREIKTSKVSSRREKKKVAYSLKRPSSGKLKLILIYLLSIKIILFAWKSRKLPNSGNSSVEKIILLFFFLFLLYIYIFIILWKRTNLAENKVGHGKKEKKEKNTADPSLFFLSKVVIHRKKVDESKTRLAVVMKTVHSISIPSYIPGARGVSHIVI